MNQEIPDEQHGFQRQRNKRSNCQHPLDHRKAGNSRETSTSASMTTQIKPLTLSVKFSQLFPSLCEPMNYTVHAFSRPEHWSGSPYPSLGDLPKPVIKPMSPTLQADSLPAEPPGKPGGSQQTVENS